MPSTTTSGKQVSQSKANQDLVVPPLGQLRQINDFLNKLVQGAVSHPAASTALTKLLGNAEFVKENSALSHTARDLLQLAKGYDEAREIVQGFNPSRNAAEGGVTQYTANTGMKLFVACSRIEESTIGYGAKFDKQLVRSLKSQFAKIAVPVFLNEANKQLDADLSKDLKQSPVKTLVRLQEGVNNNLTHAQEYAVFSKTDISKAVAELKTRLDSILTLGSKSIAGSQFRAPDKVESREL